MTTRLVTVVPTGRRGYHTIRGIRLPGSPRLVSVRYWLDGTTSYDYEDGTQFVLPLEEELRLRALAKGRRKPFAAEVEEGECGDDWEAQGFYEDDDPEAS
jgi:hypothetical protein